MFAGRLREDAVGPLQKNLGNLLVTLDGQRGINGRQVLVLGLIGAINNDLVWLFQVLLHVWLLDLLGINAYKLLAVPKPALITFETVLQMLRRDQAHLCVSRGFAAFDARGRPMMDLHRSLIQHLRQSILFKACSFVLNRASLCRHLRL